MRFMVNFENMRSQASLGKGRRRRPSSSDSDGAPLSSTSDSGSTMYSARDSEFQQLLDYVENDISYDTDTEDTEDKQEIDAFINAPIFSPAVHRFLETTSPLESSSTDLVPQYGLVGIRELTKDTGADPENRLLLANINVPWSAFICGSQGAGKSHTLSCLLESCLLKDNVAGKLPHPLAGMAMHYDNFTSSSTTQLCEAAYLCSSGIPVTVMVSPSNIWAMKRLYSNLPGLSDNSPRPKVVPFYLNDKQLDISRILKLMAVDPAAKDSPLYMEVVMKIIREMAMTGNPFTYTAFRQRIADTAWVGGQNIPLNMRLQMLESFLEPSLATMTTKPAAAEENVWTFEPGTLTIVDLSDPFINSDDACVLFSICLSIFLEGREKCGRVVAMDEAHKFLLQSGSARVLTGELTSIIRQQRHTGTRVLIATQEPTLSPELIDLANVTFVHRFLSPAWYNTLQKHLAAANKQNFDHQKAIFEEIIALRTGEALLFCPTAQIEVEVTSRGRRQLKALGNSYAKVKIRKRITIDGGRSIMATDALKRNPATRFASGGVPMHIATTVPSKVPGKKIEWQAVVETQPQSDDDTAITTSSSTDKCISKNISSNEQFSMAAKAYVTRNAERRFSRPSTTLSNSQKMDLYAGFRNEYKVLPGIFTKSWAKEAFLRVF
ncbi:putative P-loop containing nucleoside triphosphate hydrolase protein [Seiridium cardinale]